METGTATAKKEEAGGRLIRVAEENRKLAVELNLIIGELRDRLVGPVPTKDFDKDEVESSGLIFKVSSDIERTNRILREATDTTNHLRNEFCVDQPRAQAS